MSCDIVGDCCLTLNKQLFVIMTRTQVTFQRDNDDVRFVLDQHTLLRVLHVGTYYRSNQT
jgi:hypothetical protein